MAVFQSFFVCLPDGNHHGAWSLVHVTPPGALLVEKKIRAVETVGTKRHKNAGNKAAVAVEMPILQHQGCVYIYIYIVHAYIYIYVGNVCIYIYVCVLLYILYIYYGTL